MTPPNPPRPRPAMLCILDGWGHRAPAEDNAITNAKTPVFDHLWATCPHTTLAASGEEVGLPAGQMGTSEVGHLTIGAGRTIFQYLPRLNRAFANGEFRTSAELTVLIDSLKKTGGTCHLLGLASPGGVHSHQDHIVGLAHLVAEAGIPVLIHAFLDGLDVPPQSALEQIDKLSHDIESLPNVRLATLCGRYYAMDRDTRWDRIQKAYDLVVDGVGASFPTFQAAIEASYAADIKDERLLPVVLESYDGMKDGDGLLFVNFRTDRARQILTALLDPDFKGFERRRVVTFCAAKGTAEYSDRLTQLMGPPLLPPNQLTDILGDVIAKAGWKQLRIAETEKYIHVTFFFNGQSDQVFPGEERILVPSPHVPYDVQPEMSAPEVTDRLVAAIDSGKFDFIVLNYANPDMVGHTGSLSAAIKAVEAVDTCLGRVMEALKRQGGLAMIFADHGNSDRMYDPDSHGPHKAHTTEPVPLILVDGPASVKGLQPGTLADVAPTLLALVGLPQPAAMDGRNLVITV